MYAWKSSILANVCEISELGKQGDISLKLSVETGEKESGLSYGIRVRVDSSVEDVKEIRTEGELRTRKW